MTADCLVALLLEEFCRAKGQTWEQPVAPQEFLDFSEQWLAQHLLVPFQATDRLRVRLEPDSNLTLVLANRAGDEIFSVPLRRSRCQPSGGRVDWRSLVDHTVVPE